MTREEVLHSSLDYFNGDSLAASVWVDKYSLRNREGNYLEKTPEDMHWRLASELFRIENRYPNPMQLREIFDLLKGFRYFILGGSPMAGIGNDFQVTTLSNCYVIGGYNSHDSYGSIMRTDEEQVHLMKRRGGVGHDLSHLRPHGTKTSNSSNYSTGAITFMERYSATTREVAQGGRRGALMLSIQVEHPDAERFIDAKLDTGKITGANISVKISDEFMEAVRNDDYFIQRFPVDFILDDHSWHEVVNDCEYKEGELVEVVGGVYIKKIRAKKLWDKIIQNAWQSAEPGILFWDKILSESPAGCYGKEWKESSCNPCLSGDTVVAVADGRNGVEIDKLVGTRFKVYSARRNKASSKISGKWRTEIKDATAVFSGVKKVVKIYLSDGSSFICTPDHKLARTSCSYIEAKDSLGEELGKFFSFSEKNSNKSYRTINSINDGYSRQYRMMWENINGQYDGKVYNIDHIDKDSKNDLLSNLRLISAKEHVSITSRSGEDNPAVKIKGTEIHTIRNRRKNILANAKKYGWPEDRKNLELAKFDNIFSERIKELELEDKNVDLRTPVKVVDIEFIEEPVPVYDLIVEDNHNFYIITKKDDDKFLNSSGVLVHNCGELPLPDGDSCRLGAMNLFSYVENPFTSQAQFNFDKFYYHSILAQRMMDNLVDLEIEKLDSIIRKVQNDPEPYEFRLVELNLWMRIKEKAVRGRRTGLGITGEGDMLAALGLKYGSKEGVDFSVKVHKLLAKASYESSITMAKERGHFPEWSLEKEKYNPFINRVLSSFNEGWAGERGEDNPIIWEYEEYGRRNIANLTIAPTGSVSIMTQTSSGIEPCFQPYYTRRRKVDSSDKVVFTDKSGDNWEEHRVYHHNFVKWFDLNWYKLDPKWFDIDYHPEIDSLSKEKLEEVYKKSPYFGATSNDVDFIEKVKMQGRVQEWVDHSISVTINCPKEITIEQVGNMYFQAWVSGCKGVTVYRDGCREGVLVRDKIPNKFSYIDGEGRPDTLPCKVHHITALKEEWVVLVGLKDGNPFEIFAIKNNIPEGVKEGEIVKRKSKIYSFISPKFTLENIAEHMRDDDRADTRKYSLMLRHRVHPRYIVDQIEKYASISSFDKAISRVMKKYFEYIPKGAICEKCGGEMKRYEEGCLRCDGCGHSMCG